MSPNLWKEALSENDPEGIQQAKLALADSLREAFLTLEPGAYLLQFKVESVPPSPLDLIKPEGRKEPFLSSQIIVQAVDVKLI